MKFLIRPRLSRPQQPDPESVLRVQRDIALTILEAERLHTQELEHRLSEAQDDLRKLRNTVRKLRGKEQVVIMMVDSEYARKNKIGEV